MDQWAYPNQDQLSFGRPGEPTDNAGIEPFHGRFRFAYSNNDRSSSPEGLRPKLYLVRSDHRLAGGTRPCSLNRRILVRSEPGIGCRSPGQPKPLPSSATSPASTLVTPVAFSRQLLSGDSSSLQQSSHLIQQNLRLKRFV